MAEPLITLLQGAAATLQVLAPSEGAQVSAAFLVPRVLDDATPAGLPGSPLAAAQGALRIARRVLALLARVRDVTCTVSREAGAG
jgi:hypothetical protein